MPKKIGHIDENKLQRKRSNHQDDQVQPAAKVSCGESNLGGAKSNLLATLDNLFLVRNPYQILEFWSWAKSVNNKLPQDAFSQLLSMKLIGPFECLAELESGDQQTNYLASRFSTDLPEMQTWALYEGGRFAYWRDVPDEDPKYIIHIPNCPANFPTFEIVGDANPCCVLKYLSSKCQKDCDDIVPSSFDHQKYDGDFLKTLKKQRKKESLGEPFHGIGIKVPVNEKDVGYRPIYDPKKLKREMETMATTENGQTKEAMRKSILEHYSNVQYANDEMDFGMGLEFGHDLFVSGYSAFDSITKSVLSTAYQLLKRDNFNKILDAHYEYGRRKNDDKLF